MIAKTLKTIIKITYFPMVAWMIYAFFYPDTVSNEVVVGFIVYSFIILPWAAGDSVESYDWDEIESDPAYDFMADNIFYHTDHD